MNSRYIISETIPFVPENALESNAFITNNHLDKYAIRRNMIRPKMLSERLQRKHKEQGIFNAMSR